MFLIKWPGLWKPILTCYVCICMCVCFSLWTSLPKRNLAVLKEVMERTAVYVRCLWPQGPDCHISRLEFLVFSIRLISKLLACRTDSFCCILVNRLPLNAAIINYKFITIVSKCTLQRIKCRQYTSWYPMLVHANPCLPHVCVILAWRGEQPASEVALLEMVSKPPHCKNVIQMLEWFESSTFYILVLEWLNLHQFLSFFFFLWITCRLTEAVAKKIML